MLGECGMLEQDRKVLRRCSVALCKEMVVDELLVQSLQADDILTDSMAEGILAEQISQKRCWRLLSLLPKRGPRAFRSFCTALKDTEQQHLCTLLTQLISSERDGRENNGESSQASKTEMLRETEQLVPLTPETERQRARQIESPQAGSLDGVVELEVSSTTPHPIQATGSGPTHPSLSPLRKTHSENEEGNKEGRNMEIQRGEKRRRDEERESYVDSPFPLPTQEGMVAAKRARTHESLEMCLDADSPITTPVLPCTHNFYLSHHQQSYGMRSSPRGYALVISNVTFDPCAAPELDLRKGGEVDEEVLRKVFTELDYLVTVQRDLTAQGMQACIEQFRRQPDHRAADSCVVCLLSHGVEGAVYGTDGQLLQLDWVFEAFDNAHCPLLQNKPKMFFVQACRGEEMDCGVEQTDGPERTCSPGCEQRDAGREVDGEGRQVCERGRPRIKLPQRSDMICGFASLKGTAAMRNTKRGSWYIQELNAALRLQARDTHLSDILVQVNRRIKEREGYAPGTAHHRCKEMSEFTSSLCKDLFLFPKYLPQH